MVSEIDGCWVTGAFMFTLYGSKSSGSAAIEAALVLIGAPYRIVDAATWEPASALGELTRLNPLGQIPTLMLPDGGVLTESAAILIHLGLTYPAAMLLPASATERAQTIRGLVYLASNCYAAIGVIDYPERWCVDADEAFNERLRSGARARLYRYWDIFADSFQAKPFLTGASPGALDLLAAVVSRWSGARAHLSSARPALLTVLENIDRQPRVAEVFARHWDS
jgi:GST-like protein